MTWRATNIAAYDVKHKSGMIAYSIRKTCPSLTDSSDFFLNAPGGRRGLFSPGNFCALGHTCIFVRTR